MKGQACGKIILLGEHFVVADRATAGTAAIAFPLPALRCEVVVTHDGRAGCVAEDMPADARKAVEARMARAITVAADRLDLDASALQVRSRSTIPIARGFGSSAAFS